MSSVIGGFGVRFEPRFPIPMRGNEFIDDPYTGSLNLSSQSP